MNEREKIRALQSQVSGLLAENAALKLTAAKLENVVLKKTVDDLTDAVAILTPAAPVGSPTIDPIATVKP